MNSVKIISPATVANLVCGFDVLGMCLSQPFDIMRLTHLPEKKIIINPCKNYSLPTDPSQNTAGVALHAMMDEINEQTGFEISIEKNIKPGSGIGSSAASAAGAVVAANYLSGNKLNKHDLIRYAMAGEKAACGVKHADNIAPCIYGGITLIRSIFPLDVVPISFPPLYVTVVHPQIEVRTSDARQILRKEVLLKDAIRQWGNIGGLITGFLNKDYNLISRSLEDVIIEPVRSMLIPGFDEVKIKCKEAGALGGGISGSGPSVFMLSINQSTAEKVEEVMQKIYQKIQLPFHTYVTTINKEGVKIVEEENNQNK